METGRIIDVTEQELDVVLATLKANGGTELVIVGHSVTWLSSDSNEWPNDIKGALVYRLRHEVPELAQRSAQIQTLTKLVLWRSGVQDGDIIVIASSLPALRTLSLYVNQLTTTGAQAIAENLRQLTSLDIGSNQIGEAGARAIAENLRQLTSLSISSNEIGEAGARAIGENLRQLTSLGIWSNEIGEAGARVIGENLRQLTSLDIGSNQIGEAGMRAIAENLRQLTSLYIGSNEIGEAGARAIGENLRQLTSLYISYNQIGDAGARAIGENLRQLTSLYIGSNQIGDAGARAIGENLRQLTSLYIGSNQIGDAGARAIAENLRQLTSLSLQSTEIGNSTIQAIGRFQTRLKELDLSHNEQISDIGALAALPAIRSLNLTNTHVADLSPLKDVVLNGIPVVLEEYGFFGNGINVYGCPLIHPSVEIVSQGPGAVLNYFREIETQGVDRLFEAKVLILGDGTAGKTSLLRRLYFPNLPLPTEDETTRGIDIHRQDFLTVQNRRFRLNVWDFGGQQIYHATHQFFLTKNSLYILVDDTRKNDNSVLDEEFKYWLEVIEALSDSSPVLIFQNEKGGRSKTIDEAGIKARFPNVKEKYRGDLIQRNSADTIKAAIEFQVQQLPHIGEEVPAQWVVIRQAIEERAAQTPFISQDQYFEIYRQHLAFDRTKALHLSRYLHDLGVFLHFQDDTLLRRTVILQNQWATEAVFKMLDDEIVKSRFGRFTREDCERLWTESQYADMHPELLGMMIKFELCYPLADAAHEAWLAPELMSPSKPASHANWKLPSDLVISFRYTFLPKGLVNRLMVRMHRFVLRPDLSFAHGVLFEQQATQVLAEATPRGNEIELRARGPESKALLSAIASALEGLNASFKGLEEKVKQWIPCRCEKCAQDPAPEMFEYAQLVERRHAGKKTIECRKSWIDVEVIELLDGIKPTQLPDWATKSAEPRETKVIKIFLASSAELKSDRDEFDLYFRQQNDLLQKRQVYLQVIRWENFLNAMSDTRLQDEYNKKVQISDIFVSLFGTRAGKFTQEEFDTAFETFKNTGKPLIYTFFKNDSPPNGSINKNDLNSLKRFQKKLADLGHFHTNYNDPTDLKFQFKNQLDNLLDADRL